MKAIAANLAKNILELRVKRKLSQMQLAKLANIPRSNLAYMESGSGNPTLMNLSKLSLALGVGIEELLSIPKQDIELIKATDIQQQIRHQGLAIISKLVPRKTPGLEIDRIELLPGGLIKGTPHLQGTKEYFTLFQGKMSITIEQQVFLLATQDVLCFPGNSAHSYHNDSDKKAIGISVVVL